MTVKKTPARPHTPISAKTAPKPKPTSLDKLLDLLQRAEVIGILLVLAAAFTLLSLATDSRGTLTGAWVDLLRTGIGSGAWLFPFAAGWLGVWIVVRRIEGQQELPWMRPVGVVVLLLAYAAAVTLIVPAEARLIPANQQTAGGVIGFWMATALQETLTLFGAWATILFLIVAGIIFLTDRWLFYSTYEAYFAIIRWVSQSPDQWMGHAYYRGIDPMVALPTGELPWRERMGYRLRALFARWLLRDAPDTDPFDQAPIYDAHADRRAGQGDPFRNGAVVPASSPASYATQPVATQPAQPQATPRTHPTSPTSPTPANPEPEMLHPRIIGGGQEWKLPKLPEMLQDWERRSESDDHIREQGRLIQETLALFGVPAEFEGAYKGPSVTQYLIRPGYTERNIKGEAQRIKVKVAKIAALANDLALALAAPSVRIEAPIPGTNYVGVEVANQTKNTVGLKELMESETFTNMKARLKIALGEDVKGQSICTDLARMPHLLIAGATGSGKSACINGIICGLLLTNTPDTLRFLMVDPKMVELSTYNGVPHLLSPVVTEVDKAAAVLFWAVKEMERRYGLCSKVGARDIVRYNEYLVKRGEKALPYIVVVVDEMADLMMAAPEEVEKHICRLAQMARAIGIHLIIATQRPSVDVITGLIKANFPSRIAFAVTSQTDSRVVLDVPGAERLLGRGDMLFMAPDSSKLERLQGTWVSDDEINKLVRYWKGVRTLESPNAAEPWEAIPLDPNAPPAPEPVRPGPTTSDTKEFTPAPAQPYDQPPLLDEVARWKAEEGRDPLYDEAVRVVKASGRGSITLLQRELRVGYGRAARMVDQLEDAGILGPQQEGTQGRELLVPAEPKPRIIGGEVEDAPKPRVWM